MQTTIDVRDEDATALEQLSARENLSSKGLIERVIAEYVRTHRASAFGIWKGRDEDGLAYQKKMRSDWPE